MLGYSSTAANSSSSGSNEDHLQLQSPSVSASSGTPGSSRFDDVHSSGSHYSDRGQYNASSTGAVSDAALSRFGSEQQLQQQGHSPRGLPPGGASPVSYPPVFASPPRSRPRSRTAGGVLSRYIWGQLAGGSVQGALRGYQGVACNAASADAGIDPSSVLAALRPVYRAVVSQLTVKLLRVHIFEVLCCR
jgi:hypothetical protein